MYGERGTCSDLCAKEEKEGKTEAKIDGEHQRRLDREDSTTVSGEEAQEASYLEKMAMKKTVIIWPKWHAGVTGHE